VNLIGEHTDYNGGLALPTITAFRTTVTCTARDDRRVALHTAAPVPWPTLEVDMSRLVPTRSWADHVIGVIVQLGREVGPCTIDVRSDLPAGAGLGSSAALAVATLRALRDVFALSIDDRRIAEIAHRSETTFVGARVGRLDQIASSLGERGKALLIDFRDLGTESVALPATVDFAVIDSGIRHEHATGAYNERRAECDAAARALNVASLRDVRTDAWLHDLPEALRRRVRHVTSENARVRAFVRALASGELGTLGEIVNASHASLRDDFQVSLPQIDRLVTAATTSGALGARLIGGGFGGSVLALARAGEARTVAERAVASAGFGRILFPTG
jgi:galactokinase